MRLVLVGTLVKTLLTSTGPITPVSACDIVPNGSSNSHFVFYSSEWLNLHNFLVIKSKERSGIDDASLGARGYLVSDTAAARPLQPAERERWQRSVEFYAREVLPGRLNIDSLVRNIDYPLAAARPDGTLDDVALHPQLRRVLLDAMPVYRSVWWPAQDRRNQTWIASMRELLAVHEPCLVARTQQVFRSAWPSAPIRVDASVYASWFGAYSSHRPTRVMMATNAIGSQGLYGLELILHESAHGMMAPIDSALAAASAGAKEQLAPWLSHLILFYTVGQLVHERVPDHVPYAEQFGIWRQSDAAKHVRSILEQQWQPYLEGRIDLATAIKAVVSATASP